MEQMMLPKFGRAHGQLTRALSHIVCYCKRLCVLDDIRGPLRPSYNDMRTPSSLAT